MDTLELRVPEMTCRHCVRTVTACLRDVEGVETIQADAEAATVVLSGTMTVADVHRSLAACGYPAA